MTKEILKRLEALELKVDLLEGKNPKLVKTETNSSLENNISKFCSELQIARQDFDKIIGIKDDTFFLKIPVKEKNESVKQIKTTLLLMMLRDVFFGEDFMKSSEITIILKRLGVKSIGNLAKNLSNCKTELTPKGVKASKNFGFKITIPGIIRGKEILKEFIKNE